MEFYISKNVLDAIKNNSRPILTDLVLCKRGKILMNSRDIVTDCELENCNSCEIQRGAHVTLEEMV